MNLRVSNQLNMIGACLIIAQQPDYEAVWNGNPPADFATDLAALQTSYTATLAKAALAESTNGGISDAKALAKSTLEDIAYVLARALANHFKKTGDVESHAKVAVTKTRLVRLRDQELLTKTTEIRDLGIAAQSETGAEGRGVTAGRVAALTTAIVNFTALIHAPRGRIVNRSVLLREVETDTAALVEKVADMDDLVLQYDSTDDGKRFIDAWKHARIIVDSGGGHGNGAQPPTPPAPSPAK